MLGEPGRGVATIIEMLDDTRLDCVIGGAGGIGGVMQRPITQRTARRLARRLIDEPLMRNVLADLSSRPRRPLARDEAGASL